MNNTEHYDLEERVKARIAQLSRDEMRQLLTRIVDDGSVNTVCEIAAILRVK